MYYTFIKMHKIEYITSIIVLQDCNFVTSETSFF